MEMCILISYGLNRTRKMFLRTQAELSPPNSNYKVNHVYRIVFAKKNRQKISSRGAPQVCHLVIYIFI